MADSFELVGLKQANKALRNLPKSVQEDLQGVFNLGAFDVAHRAKARLPAHPGSRGAILVGHLKDAITWTARPRTLSAVVTIASEFFYWRFLEYGTKTRGAKSFLRPAAAATEADHNRRLEAALRKSLTELEREAKT